MSGSCMSTSTRSGRWRSAASMPARPSTATCSVRARPQRQQLAQHQHVDGVVFHIQQRQLGRPGLGRCGLPQRLSGGPRRGQPDAELTAFTQPALRLQGATHQSHQVVNGHQADAAALDVFAFGAQAVERLVEMGHLPGAHAAAAVAHAQLPAGGTVAHRGVGGQFDVSAAAVVLDGIAQQVGQHLAQPPGIGHHTGSAGRDLHRHLTLRRNRRHPLPHFVDALVQRHRQQLNRQRSGFDRAQIQHLVDQRQQVLPGRWIRASRSFCAASSRP